jgi:gliding motility-associated-like protein
VNPLPTASFIVSTPNCVTKDITFTDQSVANAGNLVDWTWDMGDGVPMAKSSSAPFTYSFPTTGPKDVKLVVKSTKGCTSAVAQKTVMIHPLPVPGFMMPENCINDPFSQFTDTSKIADGTEAGFIYAWTFNDPNSTSSNPNTSSVKNPKHKFTQKGTYNVDLTITSSNGCVADTTQEFVVNGDVPTAAFTVQGGAQHCSNRAVTVSNQSSVDFGTVGKVEIFWDYSNDATYKTVDDNPTAGKTYSNTYTEFFTPASKTYTVRMIAYSGDNCTDDSSFTVTIKATPQIEFTALPSMCVDTAAFQITQATVLNGMTGGVFSGPGVTPGGMFTASAAGPGPHTIRFTVIAPNGCTNYEEQTLSVFALPTANAGPDKVILEGGSGTLDGKGTGNNISFLWTPNKWLFTNTDTVPVVTPQDDITYTLTVTSADGCKATDQVFVKVLKAPTVPNVFSPNGDGINDTWEIPYLESYAGATINVYNTYGQIVYQSINYKKAWDGSFKGKPLPVGTYYYIINPKNGRKQMAGYVDIVR